MLTVGKKAPGFSLPDGEGKEIRLQDFIGKKVILYFYPKDNTSGCTKEACSFQERVKSFQKKNAVIIGISADSLESHKKFAQKYNLRFSLLSDAGKEVIKDYGVW
jgi:peroxiredoxin Q/BCP